MTRSRLMRIALPLMMLWMLSVVASPIVEASGLGTPDRPVAQEQATDPAATSTPEPSTVTPTTVTRSSIFSDDFEAYGDDSLWSNKYPFPVDTSLVASGLFAARLTSFGDSPEYGRKTLDQPYTKLFVRIRFNVSELQGRPVTLLQLREHATAPIVSIRINERGNISFLADATKFSDESSISATKGEWHELQVLVDTTSATNNLLIWLDGAEITTIRHDVWLNEPGITIVQLGDNSSGGNSDIAFDDVIVDDSFIGSEKPVDPVPGTLLVHAVPSFSGLTYQLDGKTFVSDEEGNARISVERWSTDLRSRIKVLPTTHEGGSVSTFAGWNAWEHTKTREVYATFSTSRPVRFSFTDLEGNSIDATLIDSVVLKSSLGDIIELTPENLASSTLLIASTVNTPTGLNLKFVTYYVDQVFINGANVVHRRQQSTTFEANRTWNISLLFFGVKFRAVDALFGSPLGTDVLLTSADGTETRLKLDANGEVVIPRLPRGEYTVSVLNAGYSPPRPILVSRSQVIDLEVISKLDFLLVMGAAGTVVIGLILVGRPYLVTHPARLIRSWLSPSRFRG